MNIPKSVELAGITVNTIVNNELVELKKIIGEAQYAQQQIMLDCKAAPREITEQAFFHELVHWIFYIMNEDEMRNNEKLVDLFSHLLYQALKTGGFEVRQDMRVDIE